MTGTLQVRRLRRLLVRSLLALALVLSACTGSRTDSSSADDQRKPAAVRQLKSIDTLRDAFNDDAASTRLILLISPT